MEPKACHQEEGQVSEGMTTPISMSSTRGQERQKWTEETGVVKQTKMADL